MLFSNSLYLYQLAPCLLPKHSFHVRILFQDLLSSAGILSVVGVVLCIVGCLPTILHPTCEMLAILPSSSPSISNIVVTTKNVLIYCHLSHGENCPMGTNRLALLKFAVGGNNLELTSIG